MSGAISTSFTKHPIFIGVSIILIAGLITWLCSHSYQEHEERMSQDHALYETINTLTSDAEKGEIPEFAKNAREFEQSLLTDTYSSRYDGGVSLHSFRSREDAVADLVGEASNNINAYLSHCVRSHADYDQRQLSEDCNQDRQDYLVTSLEYLRRQLYENEVPGAPHLAFEMWDSGFILTFLSRVAHVWRPQQSGRPASQRDVGYANE